MAHVDESVLLARGLKKLFSQRESFVVVGMTGRTGSGCSTSADILTKPFSSLALYPAKNPLSSNEDRKYGIVLEWARANWRPFTRISVGSLIFFFFARLTDTERAKVFSDLELKIEANLTLVEILGQASSRALRISTLLETEMQAEQLEETYNFFFAELPALLQKFRVQLDSIGRAAYTAVMQHVGDNIRRSGSAASSLINADEIFALPELINKLIKIGRAINKLRGAPDYFVIDAVRNPFEAAFFRERYAAFYLFGITTDEESRRRRLSALDLTETEITKLSEKEYPSESQLKSYSFLVSQNIGKCLELSDIIVENREAALRDNYQVLTAVLVKYVSLIQHPGLVPPDHLERCMQVALTAKLSSGCISRQVGAAITDEYFSVKAIGWNSVPEGQVPCILRNVRRVSDQSDTAAFSPFELEDKKFRKVFDAIPQSKHGSLALDGRPLSYCFKSVYNSTTKDKNQVHTRALHGEENAFLQITKYGGPGIKGGYLFTTASPCELCSKKAYQLGIKRIFYIDPYPGISEPHILSCGSKKPDLQLFTGALGRAYVQLYLPLVSQKDELEVLLKAANVAVASPSP